MSEETLYRKCLGEKFDRLAPALRMAHQVYQTLILKGRADINGPISPLYRILRKTFGFPDPATDIIVTVTMSRNKSGELWQRRFGAHQFSSHLSCPAPDILVERFGPLHFYFDIRANERQLDMEFSRWMFFIAPLPRFLAPRIRAFEHVDEQGRFCFDVELKLPVFGRLIHYRGWLVPMEGPAA